MKNTREEVEYCFSDIPEAGCVVEIEDGLLWIRMPLPMALDHVNVYAAHGSAGWTIVDTGFDTSRTRDLWRGLLAGPLSGAGIDRVIVTHHHPDHVGLAGWFKSEVGAEIVSTRTAWLTARMLTLDEQRFPTREMLEFYRAAGMAQERLERRAKERPFNFADCVYPLPLGFTRLQEGDSIRIGEGDWTALIGGGHAPDHATFWRSDQPLVIGGDQFLPDISPNIGVYASEPDADPLGDWLESCERFLGLDCQRHLVLPGHKRPFRGLPGRLRSLLSYHRECLDRLLDALKEPKTAEECILPLFRRKIGDGEYGLALAESLAHLNRLLAVGVAERARGSDGAWMWSRK